MEQVTEIAKYACLGSCAFGIVFLVLLALPQSRLRHYMFRMITVFLIVITAILGLYIISPLDFLPDIIPILGQVDDAGALLLAILTAFSAFVSSRTAGRGDYDVQRERQEIKVLPSGEQR